MSIAIDGHREIIKLQKGTKWQTYEFFGLLFITK